MPRGLTGGTLVPPLRSWPKGEDVPAVSVRQPWAAAICWAGKTIENRSRWLYAHRGPLVIHASATGAAADVFEAWMAKMLQAGITWERLRSWLDRQLEDSKYQKLAMPYGAIVAVATLAEVFEPGQRIPRGHPAHGSPWANDDMYRLHLTEITPVKPVPFKGRVGLFKVPYDVAASLQPLTGLDLGGTTRRHRLAGSA